MSKKAPARDSHLPGVKLLWMLSGGICAFPDCWTRCVAEATEDDPAKPLGEQAHIVAHSDTGPRADPTFPPGQRGTYENLILLCPTHHTLVDKQPNSFTVADLRGWKATLERRVREKLGVAAADASFAELDQVCRFLLRAASEPATSFDVLPPRDKMKLNGITTRLEGFLTIGVGGAPNVKRYVDNQAAVEEDFPERLKEGFQREYEARYAAGERGDVLFSSLLRFAQGEDLSLERQAASLAVLGYLFMMCEVFKS